jgi:hypothetical protein
MCHNFQSHGDAAPVVKTHLRLDDINQDNVACTPVQQHQLDYYRHCGLRSCHSIRHVCIPSSFDQTEPCCALYVLSTPNNALYVVIVTNNTAEKCVTPFDGDMYIEN